MASGQGGLHYDSYSTDGSRFHGLLSNFFVQPGEWVHVAWVKDGTNYQFYRNGALFGTEAAPAKFFTVNSSYWVGRVDNFWMGKLAHVRIYANALTAGQIRQDMELDVHGLLLHLPLHDLQESDAGTKTAMDLSKENHIGTATASLNLTIDNDFGPVVEFNGNNDHIELAPLVTEQLPVFTIQTWVYMDTLGGWRAIRNDQGWSRGKLHYQLKDNKLELSIYGNNPGDQWFDTVFQSGTWYNLAVCYDQYDKEVKLYINGEFAERKTYHSAIPIVPSAFWLGGWKDQARWLDGRMTGFRVYNRILVRKNSYKMGCWN